MERQDQTGYSLTELMNVLTIMAIIASIAIPNLLASRRAANEGSALQSLRAISSCEATYLHTEGNGNYTDLPGLGAKTLTDSLLSSGSKGGHTFLVNAGSGGSTPYWADAPPIYTSSCV